MSRPLLVIVASAPTMAELRRRRDAAVLAGADLVELRLDSVADPDVASALAGRKAPVIVTCRPGVGRRSLQGFRSRTSPDSRVRAAARRGVRRRRVQGWLRVRSDCRNRRQADCAVDARLRGSALGPDRARSRHARGTAGDRQGCRDGPFAVGQPSPAAARARGEHGIDRDGRPPVRRRACWPRTFTRCGRMRETGTRPGQISAARMLDEFRFREITDQTAIYGVVGSPLTHSVSPAMHNAAFRAAGVDAVYVPMVASSAEDFTIFATALGVQGVSITIPYKVGLFERADETDELSRKVGAVNTYRRDALRWEARNTDVSGFLAPLEGRLDLRGARAADSWRRRRSARGRRGARLCRQHRDGLRKKSREAKDVAKLAEGTAGSVPGGAEELGPAGKHDAGRDVPERRRNAVRRARSTAASSTTWSTTRWRRGC